MARGISHKGHKDLAPLLLLILILILIFPSDHTSGRDYEPFDKLKALRPLEGQDQDHEQEENLSVPL